MLRAAWSKPFGFALLAVVAAALIAGVGCQDEISGVDLARTRIAAYPTTTATITPTPTPSPIPTFFINTATPTPTPGTFNYSVYAGTYPISASKTQDTGCGFNPFFIGTLFVELNPDGSSFRVRLEEAATRIYTGTIQQGGNFSASGNNTFSGFTETGTVTGQLASGLKASGTETMNLTSGCPPPTPPPNHVVVYSFMPR